MTWNMEEHNRRIAETTALQYDLDDHDNEPEVEAEEKPKGLLQRIFG